jgi:hypothetical protein
MHATSALAGLAIIGLIAWNMVSREDSGYPMRPDPHLTPGAVLDTKAAVICQPGYARAHRVWDDKRGTAAKYSVPWRAATNMEDDDLVPPGLGGDNADPSNHWLQLCSAWRQVGNSGIRECIAGEAFRKDVLEHEWEERLRRGCRSGDMDAAQSILDAAQDYFLRGKWVEDMPR